MNIPLCALIALAAALPPLALAQGIASPNLPAAARGAPSGRPFPVKFTDRAAALGITAAQIQGGVASKKYIVEANGAGVALVDYDNDGWLDVFLVNSSRIEGFAKGAEPVNRLYRNNGKGAFADVSKAAGVARSGWGYGVCAGDYDNDGFDDLYVAYWGANVLYRNSGNGAFEDVTARAGVAGPAREWSSGCTFLDYDRDGRLDLFVTSYQNFDLATATAPGKGANCEWKGLAVFCGPRGMPFGRASLYRGKADGTFEDVTKASGVGAIGGVYAFTPLAADLNGDGWTDIYFASDSTPSVFLRNEKNGAFRDIATETGVAYNEHGFEQGGMGVGVGDFDRDGLLDLIKTNFSGDHPNVYRNTGGGIFEDVVLRAGLAVNPQYVGWGVAFVDLDNDGWLDVFQVNGHVYPELEKAGTSEAYRQQRLVYRNLGEGRFEDVSALVGPGIADKRSSRGAAFGDFDNDGDLDVLVMNMNEPPSLLVNEYTGSNRALHVLLEGVKSNRSAIGATVTVEAGGARQTLAVLSAASFLSQSDRRLHFGLGAATKADAIRVRWPSGETEAFPGGPAGAVLRLKEGTGAK